MSDDEFCNLLGFTNELEREICNKIRATTAKECNIDKDSLTPHDDTQFLNRKISDGWDCQSFLMTMEEKLDCSLNGVNLPNFTLERFFFLFKRNGPENYGNWVKEVVKIVIPIISLQRR